VCAHADSQRFKTTTSRSSKSATLGATRVRPYSVAVAAIWGVGYPKRPGLQLPSSFKSTPLWAVSPGGCDRKTFLPYLHRSEWRFPCDTRKELTTLTYRASKSCASIHAMTVGSGCGRTSSDGHIRPEQKSVHEKSTGRAADGVRLNGWSISSSVRTCREWRCGPYQATIRQRAAS
jgi:hypothetical protein